MSDGDADFTVSVIKPLSDRSAVRVRRGGKPVVSVTKVGHPDVTISVSNARGYAVCAFMSEEEMRSFARALWMEYVNV